MRGKITGKVASYCQKGGNGIEIREAAGKMFLIEGNMWDMTRNAICNEKKPHF